MALLLKLAVVLGPIAFVYAVAAVSGFWLVGHVLAGLWLVIGGYIALTFGAFWRSISLR